MCGRGQRGQGFSEYGLIIALLAVACVIAFLAVGKTLSQTLTVAGGSLGPGAPYLASAATQPGGFVYQESSSSTPTPTVTPTPTPSPTPTTTPTATP